MKSIFLSDVELKAIVRAVSKQHLALEDVGEQGSREHMCLRGIEDKLGALAGSSERYEVTSNT